MMNRCELCDKESVCDVVDEQDVVKSYCEDHAPDGVPKFGGEDLVPKLQAAINFIEAQLSHSTSIVLPGVVPSSENATVGKEEAQAFLDQLRELVEFVLRNKRMPGDGELPGAGMCS